MTEDFDPFSSSGSTEGLDESSMHKGGGKQVCKEGLYHVSVEKVEFDSKSDSLPCVVITMTILNGTNEDQIGRKIYHRIWVKSWVDKENKKAGLKDVDNEVFKNFIVFLYEFGVLTKSALNQDKFNLTREHWNRLENCQAVVEVSLVKNDDYVDKRTNQVKKGKEEYKIQWNNQVYRLNHEKVADVPKDHDVAVGVVYRDTDGDLSSDLDEL